MQVPPELNYNQLQTKAFFSIYKPWTVEPISNGGQYWPGEVIRIAPMGLGDGVMDPARSHIEITVEADPVTLPVGLLQLDSSAQSFFQQMVINSYNKEVERIVEYGVIAAYLNDIGQSELYTEGREVEGLGYSNIDNYQSLYSKAQYCPQTMFCPMSMLGQDEMLTYNFAGSGGVLPTIPTRSAYCQSWGDEGYTSMLVSGQMRSHVGWQNTAWLNEVGNAWWWYVYVNSDINQPGCTDQARLLNLKQYGYNNNLRAEYLANHLVNDYIDSTSSYGKEEIRLNSNVQNNTFPAKFQNTTVYATYVPDTLPYMYNWPQFPGPTNELSVFQMPNITSLTGFYNLNSPNFAKGVREPFISPTVPQCQMVNGKILNSKIPITRRTFKVPLISAVIGLGIPENQFILIPLKALTNLSIELTIDPYAMFTSGYNDISEFDNIGMGLMQQRAFKVVRIVYNLHTYTFYNAEMDEYLRINLSSGIAVNTKLWQLGNQYQVENSQSLTNSWPVACNEEALAQVLVLFVPLDYQNFTFCRKHFRISNNITKFQLRVNMDYYPSQAISGNAGNPVEVDSTGNNGVFLEQIYQTEGFVFSKTKALSKINAFNFAINDRCYNIYNTHTLYDPAMIDDKYYEWNASSVNYDTAMGMANVHENRYVGKAAYLYSFEPYNHSKNFLTGIDCRAVKSFDILFTCNPDNWFPRPQTMFIYTCSSVIIEYGKDGITNINK